MYCVFVVRSIYHFSAGNITWSYYATKHYFITKYVLYILCLFLNHGQFKLVLHLPGRQGSSLQHSTLIIDRGGHSIRQFQQPLHWSICPSYIFCPNIWKFECFVDLHVNSDNYTNTRIRFYHDIPIKSLLKIYTSFLAMTMQWNKNDLICILLHMKHFDSRYTAWLQGWCLILSDALV